MKSFSKIIRLNLATPFFVLCSLPFGINADSADSGLFCPTASHLLGGGGAYEYESGILKGGDPQYVIVGKSYTFKSDDAAKINCIADNSRGHCDDLGSTLVDYLYDDDATYAFFDGASLVGGSVTSNSSKDYVFWSRSERTAGAVAIAEYSVPGEFSAGYLLCEFSKFYIQSEPTISKESLTLNSNNVPIQASVNSTYDTQFSKVAVEGLSPTYTWTFTSISYSGVTATLTTSSPSVSYTPQYEGEYKLVAKISDGVYSASTTVGFPYYQNDVGGGPGDQEIR